ncbi:cytochrome C [Spirulina major CS-329]|uniref:cytochrome C n=1 Tax=Spirulina TaxID=1154 RepID=UPI00232F394E|nr:MULTISPECIES: cytochrome C [Spirulina]MDB9495418.1 cytochrome C [Spirulina subsalsa CS-330]MDB9504066.1 cytochrome C [Spirulina major CS-329]
MQRIQGIRQWLAGVLVLCLGAVLGLGLAIALHPQPVQAAIDPTKSVDPVPEELTLERDIYVERCGSCHVAVPPALLPRERWVELLENPMQHFGVNLRRSQGNLPPISNIDVRLMWDYVRNFSRPAGREETLPSTLSASRFFRALHPKVGDYCRQNEALSCPPTVSVQTCVLCHTNARAYDYQTLAPVWEDAP